MDNLEVRNLIRKYNFLIIPFIIFLFMVVPNIVEMFNFGDDGRDDYMDEHYGSDIKEVSIEEKTTLINELETPYEKIETHEKGEEAQIADSLIDAGTEFSEALQKIIEEKGVVAYFIQEFFFMIFIIPFVYAVSGRRNKSRNIMIVIVGYVIIKIIIISGLLGLV